MGEFFAHMRGGARDVRMAVAAGHPHILMSLKDKSGQMFDITKAGEVFAFEADGPVERRSGWAE